MIRRILLTGLASSTILTIAGCRHCCRTTGPVPRPYLPQPPAGAFLGTPNRAIPPTSVPTSPFPPAPAAVMPDPTPLVPREGNFRPQPAPVVPKTGPEVLFPEPQPPGTPQSVTPIGGQTAEPPRSVPLAPRPEASAELPGRVDIKTGVSAGLRPTSQGFRTLKGEGFRTVAYLHAPGADTTVEKAMIEKEGLTFVALEASAEKLREAVDGVNALVREKAGHPIYVFAPDARGGAVWYVHMRTVDKVEDDVAKVRADRLGLRDDDRTYWLAIQQLLPPR